MKNLFKKDIIDWNSWGTVFQSIDDFKELIEEIFIRENLKGYDEISNLTPGTNAVFKVGTYVIKIFAPKESDANTDSDYIAEMDAMKRALYKDINTPNIIAAGSIEDKYLFRYFIMDFINGKEASDVLKDYSYSQKSNFVQKLKENLNKLNTKPKELNNGNFIKERAIHNERWNPYSPLIKSQIAEILRNYDLSQCVYVHGDITADNVMLDKNDNLFIIDFADSTIAPVEYEYPPIVFELFDYDHELIHEFTKEMDYDVFIDKLFISILLHDFGANFVHDIYKKYTGKSPNELRDIYEIKRLIYTNLK
ncbi:aminoglycoside phosphotransferase family protein [Oceanirhabdus sp. W0125-5]|uniref:aminoglycoside phosphotransferase family protein n=1 Tax=Oceanirhabdus sp. W0125-5 TaxID=2999116 RepID=UPI0022F2B96B|nr:aminoglycoside phosphotransferase family protein [Oceanirhabdus sp. W0125-5]WBW96434.1 aminoglycoside phosphotransferase family protein [Oceanirhabdus sp. W0125-5]